MRGLTLRLADRELTPPAQGCQAIAIALPLLLEKGAVCCCGMHAYLVRAIAVAVLLLLEKGAVCCCANVPSACGLLCKPASVGQAAVL